MDSISVKTIYLLGAPGTGKTTLANLIKKSWGESRPCNDNFAHEVFRCETGFNISLGKNKPPFSGTDTLSNSVIERVEQMYEAWDKFGQINYILGEGDRLAIARMMDLAKKYGTLYSFYLHAPDEIINERRSERAKQNNLKLQNPTWVKGRATKHQRLAAAIGSHELDATLDPAELFQQVQDKISVI
jgi:ATPase subunit of ABC transporter with duplicated ATPase domains